MGILDGFKLDRHAASSTTAPPSVVRAVEFLDGLPANALLSSRQLEEALGLSGKYFKNEGAHPALCNNRIRVPRVNGTLWGSKKAIEEVRRRKQKLDEEHQQAFQNVEAALGGQSPDTTIRHHLKRRLNAKG